MDAAHPSPLPATEATIARIRARRVARLGAALALSTGVVATGAWWVLAGSVPVAEPAPAAAPSPSSDGSAPNVVDVLEAWWGTCGTNPLATYPAADAGPFALAATDDSSSPLNPGSHLDVALTLNSAAAVDVLTGGPDAAILFQGRVVGSVKSPTPSQVQSFSVGETTTEAVSVPLVLCDGVTPLGPGDYGLVVSQAYDPHLDGSAAAGLAARDIAPRVTAEVIPFTVAGDPATNPLLATAPPATGPGAPQYPENVMTPTMAHQILASSQSAGTWDMLAGTSRVVVPDFETSGFARFGGGYAPCRTSGLPQGTFPNRSFPLSLFSETVTLPPAITYRDGWIVDGSPLLGVTLVNTSGFYLPGLRGESTIQIYLVSGGTIVGAGYATDIASLAPRDVAAHPSFLVGDTVTSAYDLIAPGPIAQGRYVWQELHACSVSGGVSSLGSGTYTVLSARTFTLDPADPGAPGAVFQLWTSHGTIEVTAR